MATLIISLSDPTTMLKVRFREYVMAKMNRHRGMGPAPFKTFEYDGIEFMSALIDEIFKDDPKAKIGAIPKSTQTLLDAGMDFVTATQLAADVFRATLDCIVLFVPDIRFGPDEDHIYGFCEGNDLFINAAIDH